LILVSGTDVGFSESSEKPDIKTRHFVRLPSKSEKTPQVPRLLDGGSFAETVAIAAGCASDGAGTP
jgi:hypothetical protein